MNTPAHIQIAVDSISRQWHYGLIPIVKSWVNTLDESQAYFEASSHPGVINQLETSYEFMWAIPVAPTARKYTIQETHEGQLRLTLAIRAYFKESPSGDLMYAALSITVGDSETQSCIEAGIHLTRNCDWLTPPRLAKIVQTVQSIRKEYDVLTYCENVLPVRLANAPIGNPQTCAPQEHLSSVASRLIRAE